ncbi:hypothetical protein GALL_122600 [mine drainage metagenome]|uniref:Uncharacterized protein n=1 Tax=mine drainage metagenome TaxID=410659 RepID=A0A1J5SN47_9ZZZZ
MSAWFTKNLGDAMLAGEALAQLEALFLSTYGISGDSGQMAIFVRHESEGRLHCELKAYFPPAAIALAKTVDADPCARPSRDGLSLLVGPEDTWQAFFPD